MDVVSGAAARIEGVAENKRLIASMERLALQSALTRDFGSAYARLQSAADSVPTDLVMRGVLKQIAAKYCYFVDSVAAMQMQVSAYGDNFLVSRPPLMLARAARKVTGQAESIVEWISEFQNGNGALIELDDLQAKMSFGNPVPVVEEAVRRLGEMLGASATRPERDCGRGPDVLWQFDEKAFVIELKSEKKAALSKSDAGQLQQSLHWCRTNAARAEDFYGLVGSNTLVADDANDFSFGAKLLTEADFYGMLSRFRSMIVAALSQGPLFISNASNLQGRLASHDLLPTQIAGLGRQIQQK